MMAMLLIPLIPIFALVTQNVILLNEVIERKADLIESANSVENGDEVILFKSQKYFPEPNNLDSNTYRSSSARKICSLDGSVPQRGI